jgi:hypothetical protein
MLAAIFRRQATQPLKTIPLSRGVVFHRSRSRPGDCGFLRLIPFRTLVGHHPPPSNGYQYGGKGGLVLNDIFRLAGWADRSLSDTFEPFAAFAAAVPFAFHPVRREIDIHRATNTTHLTSPHDMDRIRG